MARCPAGHESQASDYCDTCGLVIGGEPAAATGGSGLGAAVSAGPGAAALGAAAAAAAGQVSSAAAEGGAASGARCPQCQAERNGRFCEECGYDFDLAEAVPPGLPATGAAAAATPAASAGATQAAEPEAAVPAQSPASAAAASPESGLDLDAELARAEAERAAPEAATPEAAASEAGASETAVPEAAPSAAAENAAASPQSAYAPAEAAPDPVVAFNGAAGVGGFGGDELDLVVDADRDYYAAQIERGDIIESEFPFPKYAPERRFSFADGPVRIGRASVSRGLSPEIDLTGPPLDPAVSHLHAQLLRHDEGWVVVDLGSANGTRLNDAEEPLEAETEIPIKQGDRIHLGVWTTITVQ